MQGIGVLGEGDASRCNGDPKGGMGCGRKVRAVGGYPEVLVEGWHLSDRLGIGHRECVRTRIIS